MSWLVRGALGLFVAVALSGAALACPAPQPCQPYGAPAYGGSGGPYGAYGHDQSYLAYRQASGYAHSYGYEQGYVSDSHGTRGYAQEYGPYHYEFGPDRYGPPPAPPYGHPGYGYAPPCCAPCQNRCGGTEGLVLPMSFFGGAGGVGPIPAGGYSGGGGFVIVGGGAGARSSASAYAAASASASVSVRGGYYGGHHGGHGGKGGYGKGH